MRGRAIAAGGFAATPPPFPNARAHDGIMSSSTTLAIASFVAGALTGAALLAAFPLPALFARPSPPPPAAAGPAPPDDDLSRAQEQLVAERMGRVRAERSLRDAVNSRHAGGGYPVLPIGRIASPFRGRWGTPRQPMLAPHARAHVLLSPAIPADALRGLEAYSHVFVLFLFDANSSMHKMGGAAKGPKPAPAQTRAERRAGGGGGGGGGEGAEEPENEDESLSRALRERHFNALVEAPALKGGRTGVLSTRSPHRPNAVGLSLCRLVSVHDRAPGAAKPNSPMLVLSGCDLVSGTPVVDIKPVRCRAQSVFPFPRPRSTPPPSPPRARQPTHGAPHAVCPLRLPHVHRKVAAGRGGGGRGRTGWRRGGARGAAPPLYPRPLAARGAGGAARGRGFCGCGALLAARAGLGV